MMTQLTDNVFAVEVPDGSYMWDLIEVDGRQYLSGDDENGEFQFGTKPLPPGTYQFLFATKEATEEQAMQVVEPDLSGWKDYEDHFLNVYPFKNSLESLHSLLRSKNLDPKKNYALLKRNEDG